MYTYIYIVVIPLKKSQSPGTKNLRCLGVQQVKNKLKTVY